MNASIQKLNDELRLKIAEAMADPKIKTMVESIKDASEDDTGRFEVVISTGDQDRHGEVIDPNGLAFDLYMLNPVVLWAHDYADLPIGVTEEIVKQNGQTVAKGRFAPAAANPKAQQVRQLYDAKIQRATSVGGIAHEIEGNTITKFELIEWSFVPVPANPFALSLAKQANIDAGAFIRCGLLTEEKTEAPEQKEKEGRVLSKKNRTLIENAIAQLDQSIAALKDLLTATDPQGDEPDKTEGVGPANQRSRGAGSAEREAFKSFLFSQQVLRRVNTVTSEALAKFNERSRKLIHQ